MHGKSFWCVVSLLVLALAPLTAHAQSGLATVTGIVTDTSGGAIPGLTVTATNKATNVPYTGVTNASGTFTIGALPIGSYAVKAELQGFKTVTASAALSAGQTARIDFKLEVGALSENIEVVATAVVLQTENAVVGARLEEQQVEKLPIQGRNLSSATLFTAGVTTPNPSSFNSLKNTGGGRPYVNGQREQANNFTLDGVDMNDAIDNLIAYQPSPDAVEQVSVETNNYSPELGNVAGAIVNMVVKSGSNQFHGNGFEYWRDNTLAATPWATNRAGGKKAEYTRNVFGGTFGGPVLPNKLFFFADYQGGRAKNPPADSFVTVIPEAWRNGDLSSLLSASTPIIVRDPLTQQPFPNNQVPVSRFSQFARNLLASQYYPTPNVARPLSDFRNNYVGKSASKEHTNQFDIKFDWNASAADKVYVRYSRQTHESSTQETAMPLLYGALSENPFWSVGVNWNRIIRNTLLNDLLVGYNNNSFNSAPLDVRNLGPLNNQLGIGGSQPIPGLSEVRIGNNISNIGNLAIGSNTSNGVWQINERLTWLKGRHSLKFGGSWQHYVMERYYSGNNGQLGFTAYTGAFSGVAFADFLMDQAATKGRGSLSEPWTHLQDRIAVYAADDFKAADKLTLNLGLRWGYTSPLVEKDDRQSNFDLTNGRQLFAGKDGNSRALYEPYYKGWEPRIGFAYRPGDRWVFRSGYGITQYMEGTGANLRLPMNPPGFFESQSDYDRTSGAASIATGFDSLRALDVPSGVVRAFDPHLRPQFTQQWNFFVEYLLGSRSSVNMGYVGNSSKYLVTPIEGNQPLPGTGDPKTWAPLQQRRPLYQFAPLITNISTTASRGRSNYHALQASFKQRPWHGVEFVANYTLGRAMSNNLGYYGSSGVAAEGAYPVNSYNIEANYGPAFFDARHIFSLSGNWDLPFGRDRQFGSGWNRALDAVLGGWAASFAVTTHTGYPITVQDSSNPSLQATRSTPWPNRIGSGKVDNPTLTKWIDRAAFQSAPLGTFGNAGVGILRAPGYWNVDVSISKRFLTVGKQYFMFRGELYNAFNHPNFGPPDRNIQSQTFGTITSTVGDARVVQLVVKYYF